jgi:hypothetical protein
MGRKPLSEEEKERRLQERESNRKRAKVFATIRAGDKFGRWEILDSGEFRTRDRVNCRCECGTICTREIKGIISGQTKSCGCFRDEVTSKRFKGVPLILDRDYAFHLDVFLQYKNGAKTRNLEFLLTIDDIQDIIYLPCHYCGAVNSIKYLDKVSGKIYYRNGIDRINNFRGYTLDNVVPCCASCNRMKMDLGYDEFLQLIEKIYKYQHGNGIDKDG